VIPVVVGSSPIAHPIFSTVIPGPLAQLVEQGTLNPKVIGSIPIRPTNKSISYDVIPSIELQGFYLM
jgi:hypothetical protein